MINKKTILSTVILANIFNQNIIIRERKTYHAEPQRTTVKYAET